MENITQLKVAFWHHLLIQADKKNLTFSLALQKDTLLRTTELFTIT